MPIACVHLQMKSNVLEVLSKIFRVIWLMSVSTFRWKVLCWRVWRWRGFFTFLTSTISKSNSTKKTLQILGFLKEKNSKWWSIEPTCYSVILLKFLGYDCRTLSELVNNLKPTCYCVSSTASFCIRSPDKSPQCTLSPPHCSTLKSYVGHHHNHSNWIGTSWWWFECFLLSEKLQVLTICTFAHEYEQALVQLMLGGGCGRY